MIVACLLHTLFVLFKAYGCCFSFLIHPERLEMSVCCLDVICLFLPTAAQYLNLTRAMSMIRAET